MNIDATIIAIAGPSGVGKSRLAYQLARQLDRPLVEVDDLYHAIQATTTPEQNHWIHFWETHPEANDLPDPEIIKLHIEVCRALSPAIAAVINNHIRTKMPVVIEGDYILPEMIAEFTEEVKTVYLTDPDVDQYVANFLEREPQVGEQRRRADSSILFGEWLLEQAEEFGLPTIEARPWDTVVERALGAIG